MDKKDYEIIVVENRSKNNMDEAELAAITGNIRYYLRDESLPTPVNAINFGVDQAKAKNICILVDGARMVTPKLIHYMLQAQTLYPSPVISAPGYHLGKELQQNAVLSGYNEEKEQELLAPIDWKNNGYRLLEVSCLSGTSSNGFFLPIGESNTIGTSKHVFDKVGGFNPGFTDTGGGQCNLDFYKRIVELPGTQLVLLLGEGSFHQYHGGVTTGRDTGGVRDEMMQRHFDQYHSIRGEYYKPPQVEPIYFGEIPPAGMRFIHHSAQAARRKSGELPHPDWEGELRHKPPTRTESGK